MQNFFLSERTAQDIDRRVAKILRDMGNPQPPLRLEEVRHLLELDLGWYSSADDGILRETLHRLTMAGKQILDRPGLLLDAVKKFSLKALWQPDRKRILLDAELPPLKQRWGEAHEIGHSILDWHEPMTHGDQKQTLSYTCHQQLEAEANFAAGRLTFLRDRFTEELFSSPLTLDSVKTLSKSFGNTITSGLWRTVESLDAPGFAMISQYPRSYSQTDGELVRYFIQSRRFSREFTGVTASRLFECLASFCRPGNGPLGSSEITLRDNNGTEHVFFIECLFNRYDALTLATYVRARTPLVSALSPATMQPRRLLH